MEIADKFFEKAEELGYKDVVTKMKADKDIMELLNTSNAKMPLIKRNYVGIKCGVTVINGAAVENPTIIIKDFNKDINTNIFNDNGNIRVEFSDIC